jgi:hypothetical protein
MRRLLAAAVFLGLWACAATASAEGFARPRLIRWGASVTSIEAALKGRCVTSRLRRIDPPFLDVIKDRQVQIDCEGFVFQGRPRHAEFVFGDDRLGMVWIMVGAEETPGLLARMTAAYGPPDRRNARYDAFTHARAALRHDRAEVLFYAPERAGDCEPDFKPGPPAG